MGHREKAGTVEMVHDVLKNELAAGVLPCGRFGANAAWLRLAVITPQRADGTQATGATCRIPACAAQASALSVFQPSGPCRASRTDDTVTIGRPDRAHRRDGSGIPSLASSRIADLTRNKNSTSLSTEGCRMPEIRPALLCTGYSTPEARCPVL